MKCWISEAGKASKTGEQVRLRAKRAAAGEAASEASSRRRGGKRSESSRRGGERREPAGKANEASSRRGGQRAAKASWAQARTGAKRERARASEGSTRAKRAQSVNILRVRRLRVQMPAGRCLFTRRVTTTDLVFPRVRRGTIHRLQRGFAFGPRSTLVCHV